MPSYLSPVGNEVQTDANGNPLVGGQIFTYQAGTTTPIATYTGSDGLTAQANPIVLNSAGLPASPIWLPAGQAVKLVFKDANNVDYRPAADNITGINDPSTTNTVDQWVTFTGAPTYISATSFSLVGDQTNTFQVGRRVKSTNTGGTRYSSITASSYDAGTGLTTVTVANDSGSLDSGLSQVSYGLISPTSTSLPQGPAFMASPSAATSLISGTAVKVTFGNQEYDTNDCYDPATSRFTPKVAGFYWIAGAVRLTNTATAFLYIYKNGVQHREIGVVAQTSNQQTSGGCMVYLSGTDYVELYCVQSAATQNSSTSSVSTWFQGHLVRLA